MNINEIIKQTKDFQYLCNEIKSQNFSKSILLYSKDSFYAEKFAILLSSVVFNKGELIENENYFRVLSNSHPDMKIYPQKEKLLVADSQEIVSESYLKPILSEKKIFIIKNIENSMESAQNKLLKILEEPPKNVFFIITSSNSNLVLPTIKSRCNKYELSKIEKKIIEEELSDIKNISLIASICDGKIGRALDFLKKENILDIFNLALSTLKDMKNSKMVLLFSNKIFKFKDELETFFEILYDLLEDILFIKTNLSNKVKFKSYIEDLKSITDDYSLKAICQIQKFIDNSLKELYFNSNQILVVENLLLNILEVKYLCK